MTVQDLIELLSKEDLMAEVVVSRDPEGNGYSPLGTVRGGFFDSRGGEFYSDEEYFEDFTGDDADGRTCVGLWPEY